MKKLNNGELVLFTVYFDAAHRLVARDIFFE